MFFSFAVVYAANILLPGLLQTLFGYDALKSGEMVSPSGISSMAAMVLCGILIGRQVDARWMIASGVVVLAASNLLRAHQNLQIGPWQVIWPHMLVMLGIGLIFAPLSVAAYKYTPLALRGAAVGIVNLLRNEGGSFGTSVSQIIQERRLQFHVSRIGEVLDPLNPHVANFLDQTRAFFLQQTRDAAAAQQMAVQSLESLRQQQAASMAFFDAFWVCAVLSAALLILVPFMKRSAAEKGERIIAE
jgi:DHA2 family multidrug resistance protein